MNLSSYLPILLQAGLAVLIGAVIIAASHIFGQRGRKNAIKDTPYECGMPSDAKTSTRFSVKFYVVAMLFILFDIEIVFLVPWAFIHREFVANGIPIVGPVLFFLAALTLGLIYEYKKRGLEWER